MSSGRIPVVIAAADIESGVTSWALRFRDACRAHPLLDVTLLNCWETGKRVGDFDATITTEDDMRCYLAARDGAIVVPNFVWDAVPLCAELVQQGHRLHTLAYLHANSEPEYYAPARWLDPVIGGLLAASEDIARNLASALPHRAGEIRSLPCAVDVPASPPHKNFAGTLRLAYGGRLTQDIKRVFDLVKLVENLLALGTPITLTIVGPGADRDALRDKLNALPHDGHVQLLEPLGVGEMPAFWAAHDVFIQVSESEGTSCSMLEAMAQGCIPCVTNASSSVRAIVSKEAGFIVQVGDMAAMAQHLHALSQQPAHIAVMSAAAHAAVQTYAMPAYVERFAAIAQQLVQQPPRPWPAGHPHQAQWHRLGHHGAPWKQQPRFLKPAILTRLRQGLAHRLTRHP